jgi:hypothetical protein
MVKACFSNGIADQRRETFTEKNALNKLVFTGLGVPRLWSSTSIVNVNDISL